MVVWEMNREGARLKTFSHPDCKTLAKHKFKLAQAGCYFIQKAETSDDCIVTCLMCGHTGDSAKLYHHAIWNLCKLNSENQPLDKAVRHKLAEAEGITLVDDDDDNDDDDGDVNSNNYDSDDSGGVDGYGGEVSSNNIPCVYTAKDSIVAFRKTGNEPVPVHIVHPLKLIEVDSTGAHIYLEYTDRVYVKHSAYSSTLINIYPDKPGTHVCVGDVMIVNT